MSSNWLRVIIGVKALVIVGSAIAIILEAFIAGETWKIEKDTDAIVKIETQIKELVELAKK